MGPSATRDDELHRAVGERLRAGGQIYTSGRRRLVEQVSIAERPMTIPELLDGDRSLTPSSVYRNLTVLEELAVVSRITTGGEHARFELAEDLAGHHHHLICVDCGRVEDFEVPAAVEATVERALAKVARANRFEPLAHRLDLLGRCADCQAEHGRSGRRSRT